MPKLNRSAQERAEAETEGSINENNDPGRKDRPSIVGAVDPHRDDERRRG